MVKDAEAHAADDKKRRELVEARNHADGLIHTTERSVEEAGDKVPAGDREAVQSAVQALKDVLGGEDAEAIKAKTEALGQVAMKLGEALYKAQTGPGGDAGGPEGGPGGGGGGPTGGPGSDKVVDADFEEVDDQKKRGSA